MSLLSSGPSGFHNAPVTKTIIYTCVLISVIAAMLNDRKSSRGALKRSGWKLFASPFLLTSMSETLLSIALLYVFRCFERFYGSQKYCVFVVYSYVFSSLVHAFLLFLARFVLGASGDLFGLYWKSGPYGLLFASLVIYFVMIPATTTMRLSRHLSYTLTEKHAVYLLALQLLLLNFWRVFPMALCGVIAGVIYVNNRALRSWKLPSPIARWFAKHIFPLINSQSVPSSNRDQQQQDQRNRFTRQRQDEIFGNSNLRARNVAQQQQQQEQGFDATAATQDVYTDNLLGNQNMNSYGGGGAWPPRQRPLSNNNNNASEDNIALLTGMGFDREEAIRALNQTNNNIQEATEILLTSM